MSGKSDLLRSQAEALTHEDLQTRYTSLRKSLASADERRGLLATQLFKLKEAIRERERALLLEHAGKHPQDDHELEQLRTDAEDIQAKLRAIPAEIEQLQEVVATLRQESDARASCLGNLARKHCEQQWKGKATQYADTARKVLAEAALAHFREHTEDTVFIDMQGFIQTVILPLEAQAIFRAIAEAELREAKQYIIKNNNKLG